MKKDVFSPENPGERIAKIRIPDEEMIGWFSVLKEAGFSEEECNELLGKLNKTLRDLNKPKEEQIAEKMKQIEDEVREKHKYYLNNEEKSKLRKLVEISIENDQDINIMQHFRI